MRIVLTGGGTGGHVMPFETIVESLRTVFLEQKGSLPERLNPKDLYVDFVGVVNEHTRELFTKYDIPVTAISAGKLRRYASGQTIGDLLWRLPLGIIMALVHIWKIMPDVIISKGGYGSFPVIIAAIFYRIPFLLHESDAAVGLANSLALRYAAAVSVGLPSTQSTLAKWQYKIFVTGTPVRSGLTEVTAAAGKKMFGLPEQEPVLLVMGGSQGAKQINATLLQILPQLITSMAVIHLTGPDHHQAVQTVAQELLAHSPRRHLYKVFPYLGDEMAYALAAADAVVSRAGASTLSELARLHKPALLIPLDGAANDHQRKNARAFESAGAALVLDPTNLGQNVFQQNVKRLMTDDVLRAALAKNIARLDFPQAARSITELAFKLAQGFAPKKSRK